MCRAKRNIETLIPRLHELGYQFQDKTPLLAAPRHTAEKVKILEKTLAGRLPFSLIAWWEQIGQVSFLGNHPTLPFSTADPMVFAPIGYALETLENWTGEVPFYPPIGAWQTSIEAWRRSLRAEGFSPSETEATLAPSIAGFEAQDIENEQLRALPFDPRFRFPFAPDELKKAEVKGGTYDVPLPSPTADFVLEGARGTPQFVAYLRESFQHGGFRAWQGPQREMDFLTQGLLPL
jgi:hypothetical protein